LNKSRLIKQNLLKFLKNDNIKILVIEILFF